MDKNQFALASLSMDLKRAAMGYHRGSIIMAKRFFNEALKRRDEIDQNLTKSYLRKFLANLDNLILQKDQQKIAEDFLMYSTIFQNAALKQRSALPHTSVSYLVGRVPDTSQVGEKHK